MAKTRKPSAKIKAFREVTFLNMENKDAPSTASIHVKPVNLNARGYSSDDYNIRVSDCSEIIVLHGSLRAMGSRRNALHKMDTLIELLKKGREHLVEEFDRLGVRY